MTERVPVVHGGVDLAELAALGIDPIDVLDLSANLHPRGPHPHVLLAARDADLRHYPEPGAGSLRDAIAARSHLEPAQVLVTPGATAAIHLATGALLAPGEPCALWPPTFGEYAAAIEAAGGRALEYRSEPPAFEVRTAIEHAPLGILCNPNNPTGIYLTRAAVEQCATQLGTLVLDVAYDAFVDDAWDADDLVRAGAPVLVVHSMTKLHAVPGVRVGYVTGPAPLIARLARRQPAWSVSATALAAGDAMLTVEQAQRIAAREVSGTRALLADGLRAVGLPAGLPADAVSEGRANFVLARVGDARAFRLALMKRGFLVRDCTSFGLPEWVRIAVPVEVAARRLLRAIPDALLELQR